MKLHVERVSIDDTVEPQRIVARSAAGVREWELERRIATGRQHQRVLRRVRRDAIPARRVVQEPHRRAAGVAEDETTPAHRVADERGKCLMPTHEGIYFPDAIERRPDRDLAAE